MTRADGGLDIVTRHLNIQDGARAKMPFPIATGSEKYPPETDALRKERTGLSSLQITDDESKAVQKTPNRVALADIEAAIKHVEYINTTVMPHLTICVIYLQNGWAEIGHSAPADAGNFDAELGKKFAKEAAMRKLWPLFGFALREKLTGQGEGPKAG